jgi:hypothetical protein
VSIVRCVSLSNTGYTESCVQIPPNISYPGSLAAIPEAHVKSPRAGLADRRVREAGVFLGGTT